MAIQFPIAPTHTIDGINWADAWHISLTFIGAGLLVASVLNAIHTEHVALRNEVLETE